MNILNQSIKTMQDYVTWILTVLLFILKSEDFFEDIADDVEKRFDTSNYEINRPLSTKEIIKQLDYWKMN